MSVNIAVIGATGNVGINVLEILKERNFPINSIYALASLSSIGKTIYFDEKPIVVESLEDFDFTKVDIAIFAAGSKASSKYVPIASKSGCICIDNTSFFRMHSDVPLVVPEINFSSINSSTVIANPNCIVVPLVLVLHNLQKIAPIKRVVVSTYQSVSGAGKLGIDELQEQTKSILEMRTISPKKFAKQIAFNALACIDDLEENGFTKEENKIREETKKILHNDSIEVVATCVRVPIFIGHSMSVNIEFSSKISIEDAIDTLSMSEGISLKNKLATPIECSGKDEVYVSRIRKDFSLDNGLCMWIVSDNVRKGAALNAIQIAELLLESKQYNNAHKLTLSV